jgi:hypothetical protein
LVWFCLEVKLSVGWNWVLRIARSPWWDIISDGDEIMSYAFMGYEVAYDGDTGTENALIE